MGQHWELSVGGVSELIDINEYIPLNGVEVLFSLITTTETVNVDLGKLLKYLLIKTIFLVSVGDNLDNKINDLFSPANQALHHFQLILLRYPFHHRRRTSRPSYLS